MGLVLNTSLASRGTCFGRFHSHLSFPLDVVLGLRQHLIEALLYLTTQNPQTQKRVLFLRRALSVASAIGNVLPPPTELPPSTAPSAASLYSFGLMDSLTGFAKGGVQKGGATQSAKVEPTSSSSGVLKKEDKDALRTFIAGAMPTGELRSFWDLRATR
jgi:hypothetical protein